MIYGQLGYPYGCTILTKSAGFSAGGMTVLETYVDFSGKPSSDNDIQLMVISEKM